MSKPIKDWGVVKFLSKKLPKAAGDIASNVADVVLRGESPIKAVLDVIRGGELTPEETAKAIELAQIDHEEYLADLEDRKNARAMQIEALKSDDKFAKRFIYYYAAAMTAMVFFVIAMLFFVEIPEDNKRIIDMVMGVIVGTGLAGVFNFFFGSSEGSKSKENAISSVLSKIKTSI